jgi:hypothetical protein
VPAKEPICSVRTPVISSIERLRKLPYPAQRVMRPASASPRVFPSGSIPTPTRTAPLLGEHLLRDGGELKDVLSAFPPGQLAVIDSRRECSMRRALDHVAAQHISGQSAGRKGPSAAPTAPRGPPVESRVSDRHRQINRSEKPEP